ncbi:MAG: CBS domain-containing protein [Thermoplasmata archaeon]|nr:CBS domain-containing protein [Thermoplasmata archaeon]
MSPKEAAPTAVRELGYELKVRDAMNRDILTVNPETRMSELRPILRSKRIAGVPVMEGEKLVGVICVEDMVNWFTNGAPDCPVKEKMSRDVKTLYADEPLIHAVNSLERFGFFHFPVLDRRDGKLVGVVTREDVIRSLLRKLEIEYREEEIRRYRASHIFEDIVADKSALLFHYYIVGQDFEQAGNCSGGLKKTLKRLGIHPDIVRRVPIATYEAEMNIVIYARTGEVIARVDPNQIRVEVEDSGPGIPDIEKALQPGFSTAPEWVRELGFGAGMGLHNIQQCADEMNVTSTVGKGTRLEITIAIEKERVSYEVKGHS